MVSIAFCRFCRLFCHLFFKGILFSALLLLMRTSFTSSNTRVTMINIYRFSKTISGTSRSSCLRSFRVTNNYLSANGNAFRIMRNTSTTKAESMFNLTNACASNLRSARDDNVRCFTTCNFSLIRRGSAIARAIRSRYSRIYHHFSLRVFRFTLYMIFGRSCQILRTFLRRLIYRNTLLSRPIKVVTLQGRCSFQVVLRTNSNFIVRPRVHSRRRFREDTTTT